MRFKLKVIYYSLRLLLAPKHCTRAALEHYQQRKMRTFAKRVLSKSAFYAPFATPQGADWSAVPVISKTQFMQHFDQINTVNITQDRAMQLALDAESSRDFKSEIDGITVGLSTGTSGKRGLFLVSENERAQWTAVMLHKILRPQWFKKQKIAFFLRANSNLYSSVSSSLFQFAYFDIFKPLPALLEALQVYQPDILAAQPSILMEICLAQRSGIIQIRPKQVISFAEVLHHSDKQMIETTFQTVITEVYQCTEGCLGISCKQGTMHLQEEFIVFEKEWIDDQHFYPIITDFTRASQPVVKYRMSDVLKISPIACPCGSVHTALAGIIGRDDDVLIFGDKKLFPDVIARKIAMATDNFHRYSIVQVAAKQLEVAIATDADQFIHTKEAIQMVLHTLLAEHAIEGVDIRFSDKIEQTIGAKKRKIKRTSYEV